MTESWIETKAQTESPNNNYHRTLTRRKMTWTLNQELKLSFKSHKISKLKSESIIKRDFEVRLS